MVLGSAPHFWKLGILSKPFMERGSCSPQPWSFLDHRRFFHIRGGSSQEPAWPLSFPILLFKIFEKEKCCFVFFTYLPFSWNGDRKELNQNSGSNSGTPDSRAYLPQRNKDFFQVFFWGTLASFPLLCLVARFWSPALSWLHPDPSLPQVWVTRATTLPAPTYSVPQLLR